MVGGLNRRRGKRTRSEGNPHLTSSRNQLADQCRTRFRAPLRILIEEVIDDSGQGFGNRIWKRRDRLIDVGEGDIDL